jgi:hypothetical protein
MAFVGQIVPNGHIVKMNNLERTPAMAGTKAPTAMSLLPQKGA